MKTISTEIIIHAPKEKVWAILSDFDSYPDWNPFITNISGELSKGKILEVTISLEGRKPSYFKPVVLNANPNEKFCWKGKLFIGGLFDGTHYFNLEDAPDGNTRLVHGENFNGILVGFIMKKIGDATLDGFRKMNEALKQQAEQSG
jgi:hypothetical protein